MEQNRKRVTAPRIAAALSVLLAGAALYTVSGSERQGIQVKEYAEAAEAADSTIMVYMNGSDLEGDYGAATADLWEMMDALKVMEQEGKSPSLHVVVEAGGSTRWELDEMDGTLCQIFPDRGWNIIHGIHGNQEYGGCGYTDGFYQLRCPVLSGQSLWVDSVESWRRSGGRIRKRQPF